MKTVAALIILLTVHLLILVNLQFTAWPEMTSYPYLLDHGFKLYKDIALPYQPLLVLILSGIYKLFGYNLLTLQLFTWVIIIFSDVLIFLISQKFLGKKLLSLLPPALYVLLQPFTFGNMLWFDLATVPFMLLGIISLINKKFIMMGVFWGIALFIKQQVGISIAFLILYLIFTKQFGNLYRFSLGILSITAIILLYVIFQGITFDYPFWTFTVPIYWYPKFPGYSNWPTLLQLLTVSLIFLPGVILTARSLKTSKENSKIILLAWLGLFLVAFPRFDYFRFQPALAVYIILIASILKKGKIIFLSLPILLAIFILSGNNLRNINVPARFYGSQELMFARRIEESSLPEDRIYLLGVPSIGYVLSNRLPPKPWVDNYVWYMEIEGMQDKVIQGFEQNSPKLIFWKTPEKENWYDLGTYQPRKIVAYIKQHYEKTSQLEEGIEVWRRKD